MKILELPESIRESWARALTPAALSALRITPDGVLMAASDMLLRNVGHPEGREFLKTVLLLSKRHLSRMAPAVRRSILNFMANVYVKGEPRRRRFAEKFGFEPPILLVISPTMRCNLECYGCYAGRYSHSHDLGLKLFDRILDEAEDMGIFFMTISGGEPFILGRDLIDIMSGHRNMLFQIYTNGTLIDSEMAKDLAGVGNGYPCISVEGFREETDSRRGPGAFEEILSAMDNLRREGVLFGFSATATRENNELIVSDRFIDFYQSRGALIGWYFHYVPVGKKPGMELMPTPEQRIFRMKRLPERRKKRDILLADFWNDGPLVGGCLAAGRYLHINACGDVEPCVFTHFAVDNIRDKSLEEVLRSDFFNRIREKQPYDQNLFRPCMIIDLPEVLREVVNGSGAHPTHAGAGAVIEEMSESMDEYAEEYRRLADPAWQHFLEAKA